MATRTRNSLIDAHTRHAVFVQGLATHMVNDFDPFLVTMAADLRKRLSQKDITEFTSLRLRKLLAHVEADITRTYREHYGVLREQVVDFTDYEAGFVGRSLKNIAHVEYDLPSRSQLRAAVLHKPLIAVAGAPDMKSFYRDWAGHEIENITGIIKRGYYSGQTNQQILRQVIGTKSAGYADGRLGVAKRHMETLIRTSVQHAANVARQETYAANDDIVFGYQIVATLDGRTSAVCQSMDGMIFPNDGENHPAPPFHPSCRTTTVPVLDPAFAGLEEGATRIAKGADGTEIVDADMTYFEWLKTQPPEFQDAAIGPRRGELLRNGGLTAERFRQLNMNRNFEPRTLAEMRELEPLAFEKVEAAKINQRDGDESVIFIKGDIRDKIGEPHAAALDRMLKDAPELERQVWEKLGGELRVAEANRQGVQNYSPSNGVRINFDNNAKGDSFNRPHQTTFHEFAHNIDNVAGGGGERWLSVEYNNGAFGKAIKQDVDKKVDTTLQYLKSEFDDRMRANDYEWLSRNGFITDADARLYARSSGMDLSYLKVNRAAAYRAVGAEIRRIDKSARAEVSDIVGGATGNKARGDWGHNTNYWKRTGALEREAFAGMNTAAITNPESLEQIKNYLPESYKIYQEMMKTISERN